MNNISKNFQDKIQEMMPEKIQNSVTAEFRTMIETVLMASSVFTDIKISKILYCLKVIFS